MNTLIVPKVVYIFQDLVLQKKIKTFSKFLCEVSPYFAITNVSITDKFIYKELKNMHEFLKQIQHYQNSHLLARALVPLFEMLLNNLIITKIVTVYDQKFFYIFRIKYLDLISDVGKRAIIQVSGDSFVIPYKGKVPAQVREKNARRPRTKSWVFNIVMRKILSKLARTQIRFGEILFNPGGGWSREKKFAFGVRLSDDYFSSDSEFLPREIFDMGNQNIPDIPEGH